MTETNQLISDEKDSQPDDIDLRDLFNTLFKAKKTVILITAICSICSVLYALSLTNYYLSESVMSVRNSSENQGLLSQFSGAASLMGVNLSSSGDNRPQQVIQLIQSRNFVKHLLTFDGVLTSIMAPKSYDSNTKELQLDPEIYDPETKNWKGEPKEDGSIKPSYLDVYGVYMEDIVTVSQDTGTGFISISVTHISPYFAKEFLDLIIKEANSFLRNKDLEESREALKYLRSQLEENSLVQLRESINNLIESQLEIQMMANINEDYVLVNIDPPYIPEKIISNNKILIVVFSTILGSILGSAVVLLREYLLRIKEADTLKESLI
tara:strand:+ start:122 stop:1093 length:972 start_codon:yes stop_codon:yes gene_type:complete